MMGLGVLAVMIMDRFVKVKTYTLQNLVLKFLGFVLTF